MLWVQHLAPSPVGLGKGWANGFVPGREVAEGGDPCVQLSEMEATPRDG